MRLKNFVCVFDSIPHIHHGGGGVTAYSIARVLLGRGHQVTIICLVSSRFNGPEKTEEEHVEHLESLGAEVVIINSETPSLKFNRLMAKVLMKPDNTFWGLAFQARVRALLDKINPDAILAYHWNSVASLYSYRAAPKMGVVGDPAHLPRLFRNLFQARYGSVAPHRKIVQILNSLFWERKIINWMAAYLNDCEICGAFASHHATMLKSWGAINCQYFKTPTPDPLPQRCLSSEGNIFKILHIGHLQGIATLLGVELLASRILPSLVDKIGCSNFEVHLVGGYFETMPIELQKLLRHPAVRIRGQVSPADDEFSTSHIVLVPTPIELGVRVRILTAFSFGRCIVAHHANKQGIPELQHGVNCLLGSTGEELASHCVQLLKDVSLRERIERGARETYENNYSFSTAGKALADHLEFIADQRFASRM